MLMYHRHIRSILRHSLLSVLEQAVGGGEDKLRGHDAASADPIILRHKGHPGILVRLKLAHEKGPFIKIETTYKCHFVTADDPHFTLHSACAIY